MAVTTARSRPGGPPEYIVIRENLDNGDVSLEEFEFELEKALEEMADIIVIEPSALGDETARWIRVGNWLHKTSVLAGLVNILGQCVDKSRHYVYLTFGVASVVCASVYAVSWQNDPCCKYQVEDNVPKLETLLTAVSSATPVVLVRKDDCRRKKLHTIIAMISGILCAWKVYKIVKS